MTVNVRDQWMSANDYAGIWPLQAIERFNAASELLFEANKGRTWAQPAKYPHKMLGSMTLAEAGGKQEQKQQPPGTQTVAPNCILCEDRVPLSWLLRIRRSGTARNPILYLADMVF
jgi:hypothetical protein